MIAFLSLFLIAPLLLWMSASSVAQKSTTFSGRLIDMEGNPISHIAVSIWPHEGPGQNRSEVRDNALRTVTDAKGRFTFSGIVYDSLKLHIDCSSKIGYEINVLSVEFGEITLYPERGWHWSSVKFALEPGVKMENVIITADIRTRPKIRTRVVYANGTSLANAEVYMCRQTNHFIRGHGGSSQLIKQTDADGYIVEYLHTVTDQLEHYITLAVEHQGLFAKAIPFVYEGDVDLVLRLDGNPKLITQPPLDYSDRFSALKAYLDTPPVWAVNPANGHAYKKTHNQTIKEAIAQATAEGVYLVAINDEAEEKWLQHVFGNESYWIGLSDAEEEGQWQWHSGEPVKYTRWGIYEPEGDNSDAKDYVMTEPFGWDWEATSETHVLNSEDSSPRLRRAILEKGTMPRETPSDQN